jgi:PAS domain S-box-containing protein
MGYKDKTKGELIKEIKLLLKENNSIRNSIQPPKISKKTIIQNSENFLNLFKSAREAVFLVNEKTGKIIDANPSAIKLYGYSKKELLRKSFKGISVKLKDKKQNKSGLSNSNIFHLKKNGSVFPVEISGYSTKINSTNYLIKIIKRINAKPDDQMKVIDQIKFLQNVINSSPNFIFVKDDLGRFVLTNKNWTRDLKYSPKEIIGKTVFDVFPDREIAKVMLKDDDDILRNKKKKIIRDEKYIDKNDNIRWVHTIKMPMKDEKGKIKFIIGISVDITDRKIVEEKIKEREKNYRSLIETSSDAIYVLQGNKIVLINKAWEKLFGYTSKEVTAKNFNTMSIVAPESKSLILKRFKARSINKQIESRYDMKGLTKNGNIIDLEVNTTEITWNGRKSIQGIYRDITERKRIEEALRREAFIFDNLYDAVLITDQSGNILNWNASATKLYGYTKDEVLNKSADILNNDKSPFMLIENITEAVSKEGKWTGEVNFVRKDGTSGISETIVFPFLDSNGEQIALVGVNRDITERKRIEKELRESEDKFRKLAEKSMIGVYLIQDDIFKYINPRFAEIFEYNIDEIINKVGPRELSTPESFKKINDNIIKRITGQVDALHYEFQGLTKSNKIIEAEVFGSRTVYLGKSAVIGTLLDITERKQSEKALQESIKRYQELADLLPQTVFEVDINGKLTFVNQASYKLFGYTHEDFEKGLSVTQMISPDEREIAFQNIQKILMGEKVERNEYFALRKNGTTFPVLIFINPIRHEGLSVGFRGILLDISERRQSEEQLRKLSRAVEQSPTSIIITNIKGDIEYVNPHFNELTGYSFEEVIGKNPRILKSGHTSSDEYKGLWESITAGKKWRGEFHNMKKNGELYWEEASISPIVDQSGKITHFLAIKVDITDRKKIEEELINAKEKAEESEQLKSNFLAQMSHEIRSPINVILSYNSFLKEELKGKLDTFLESSFSSIDSAGKRLLRTIDLILNMAALQSGYIDLKLADINISDILRSLISEFDVSVKSKNLTINFNLKTENTSILADDYLVTEIFQNLIGNAIKYTSRGSIEIKVYENDDKKLSVDIIDTGIGISEEYLPKLFKPFTQEETGYSRSYEGNGLGLALVKNYVDLIGAEINVRSEKESGSVFTVIFNK